MSVWDWTVESDSPLCQVSLGPDYSYQTYMAFHHDDPHQMVSNSEDLVVFYNWVSHLTYKLFDRPCISINNLVTLKITQKDNEIKFHAHPVLDKVKLGGGGGVISYLIFCM